MRKGEDAGGVRRENSIQEREKGSKEGGRGRDKETRKKEGESKDCDSWTPTGTPKCARCAQLHRRSP